MTSLNLEINAFIQCPKLIGSPDYEDIRSRFLAVVPFRHNLCLGFVGCSILLRVSIHQQAVNFVQYDYGRSFESGDGKQCSNYPAASEPSSMRSKWVKEGATYFSPSPTYRDMIEDGSALNVVTPGRDASSRAMEFFLVPGGPWKRIPSSLTKSTIHDGRDWENSTENRTCSMARAWPEYAANSRGFCCSDRTSNGWTSSMSDFGASLVVLLP